MPLIVSRCHSTLEGFTDELEFWWEEEDGDPERIGTDLQRSTRLLAVRAPYQDKLDVADAPVESFDAMGERAVRMISALLKVKD